MESKYEKIIRQPDGSRVRIRVSVGGYGYDEFKYLTEVMYCPFRKRKWFDVVERNSFEYRRLDQKGRIAFAEQARAKYVSRAEILDAEIELWKKLKPL